MSHKFAVGHLVEYRPIGKKPALFKVVRQMPEEFQAFDWKYRIKNDQEGFERSALECDLSPAIIPEELYGSLRPSRRSGSHH